MLLTFIHRYAPVAYRMTPAWNNRIRCSASMGARAPFILIVAGTLLASCAVQTPRMAGRNTSSPHDVGSSAPPDSGTSTSPHARAAAGSANASASYRVSITTVRLLDNLAPVSQHGDSASQQDDSLWDTIRAGFRLKHDAHRTAVRHWIAYYSQRSGMLEQNLHRAKPYLRRIVQDIKSQGLPMELVLLPEVESAYNPFARSDASQATGLWQFMAGTAKRFGLRRDWWYDGRRNILRSTQAALSYLKYLSQMFHGNWLLAMAAYNSGEGAVQKAIRYNVRHGLPTDFWHLRLPHQTEEYVPKVLALSTIVSHPKRYGIKLPRLSDKPRLKVVKVPGQIDLSLAARLAGISTRSLRMLNPGYRRWATDPSGPHQLLLPVKHAARFKRRLASIPQDKRVTWRRYVIQHGDTLGHIAARFHTTPAILKHVNHLHGTLIRTGQSLLIPVAGKQGTNPEIASTSGHRPETGHSDSGGAHRDVASR